MSTLWKNFTKAEQDAGWPETLTYWQLAALQYPYTKRELGKIKLVKDRAGDMLSACKSGTLPYTAKTETVMVQAARNMTPTDLSAESWDTAHTRGGIAYGYTIPAQYKDVTTYAVTAPAFAFWLAEQSEAPSDHIAAWFKAQEVNTLPEAAPAPLPPATLEKKPRKQRASWKDELPYIAGVFLSTTQTHARGLWRELKAKADTTHSPFTVGKGIDRDKLIVKDTGATLMEHTLENNMGKIREQTIKSN